MNKNNFYKNYPQQCNWRQELLNKNKKENDQNMATLQNIKSSSLKNYIKSPESSSKLALSKVSTKSRLYSIADKKLLQNDYSDNQSKTEKNQSKEQQKQANKIKNNDLNKFINKTDYYKSLNKLQNNQKSQEKLKVQTYQNNFIDKKVDNFVRKNNMIENTKPDVFDGFRFDQNLFLKSFELQQTIGKGSYATVYKAIYKQQQLQVAIKIYEVSKLTQNYKIQNLKREIKILRFIIHPNIVKLHFAIKDNRSICLVMENFSMINLKQYLQKQSTKTIQEKDAQKILIQILKAIDYIHQNNIIHRDIKPDNILIDKNKEIKLIDFGFSIISTENKKLNMFCGTPSFMSPQIVNKQNYIGQKADIWAVGVLYYYILFGRYPFRGSTDTELYKNISKVNMIVPENYNKQLKEFFKQIFIVDEFKRMTADQLLKSNYLS